MSEKTVFKSVSLPPHSRQLLTVFTRENTFDYVNSDYAGFDLNEIIMLAKSDPDAKEEYIDRIHGQIEAAARNFHLKKKFIDESDIYSRLADTALQAIEIYDPEKGDAMHLLNRMFKISMTYLAKDKACEYSRMLKYYGNRVGDPEAYSYQKSLESCEEETKMMEYRSEVEEYMDLLTETEKSILTMYSHHLTFEEIGKRLNIPTSTVSNSVYQMISELRMRLGVRVPA